MAIGNCFFSQASENPLGFSVQCVITSFRRSCFPLFSIFPTATAINSKMEW